MVKPGVGVQFEVRGRPASRPTPRVLPRDLVPAATGRRREAEDLADRERIAVGTVPIPGPRPSTSPARRRALADLDRRPAPAAGRHLLRHPRRSTLHRVTTPGTEADLLARVVAGDRQAFDLIMRSQEDRGVRGLPSHPWQPGQRPGRHPGDVPHRVPQGVQFQGNSALGTWIYRIAVNTCYDQIRKTGRRPTEPLDDHFEPVDQSAEDAVQSAGSDRTSKRPWRGFLPTSEPPSSSPTSRAYPCRRRLRPWAYR